MEENNVVSLDTLEYVQSGGPTDDELSKLDGCRVDIANVEIVEDNSRWKDGVELPEGQEIKVQKIKLTTEPFGTDLIGREITHVEKYNLKNKDGRWIVSLHEKSKTGLFLAKYQLGSFKDTKGTSVVLIKKTNPNTKRSFLMISI